MLLLKKSTFTLSSDTAHVSPEEAAVVASATDVIAAARTEAEKIVAEAKVAYEEEKKRGYEDGLKEARENELARKLELVGAATSYMEKVEGAMGDLVVKALKKCVVEIGDQELIFQIVRKAMQAIVRAQRQITIKVSPDMVPVIKERLQEILKDFPSVAFAEVQEDAHLAPTACVIDTAAGSVESSIDGQLEAIEKSIRRHFSKDLN